MYIYMCFTLIVLTSYENDIVGLHDVEFLFSQNSTEEISRKLIIFSSLYKFYVFYINFYTNFR